MLYTHFGEMFELLPIYAAATLLGLISGVLAVHLLTTGAGRFSLRVLMGGVVWAAILSCLLAAKPAYWSSTAIFWALAFCGTAILDLAVVCLLDPWGTPRRFSRRSVRRIGASLVLATAALLAAVRMRFDFGPAEKRPLTLLAVGMAIVVPAATLDVATRLVIRWIRRRPAEGERPGDFDRLNAVQAPGHAGWTPMTGSAPPPTYWK
jgi:hypothetical protein